MKKLLLILLIPTLFGCEKIGFPSNPQLNLNGRWDVVDIDVIIDKVNYGSQVSVISDNEAAISNFYVDHINSDGTLVLTQKIKETSVDKRFMVNKTRWDFEYNRLYIYENNINVINNGSYIYATLPCTYCTTQTILEWDYMGSKTRYTFSIDTYGAMPGNVLKLTSQSFVTNIMINNNSYDKAIISHLVITLHKK